jgi:two-component system chemotaxis response regulator CheB
MSARPSSLVVIGASAGGIEPLKVIAAGLPPDLAAAVAIVFHVSPTAESRLPAILSRVGRLPVRGGTWSAREQRASRRRSAGR